jgi:hypothetical protein
VFWVSKVRQRRDWVEKDIEFNSCIISVSRKFSQCSRFSDMTWRDTRSRASSLPTPLHLPPSSLPPFPSHNLSPPSPTNLLPQPITPHLLPLHLLSRNRQLSSQPLKSPLTQLRKPSIQFFLILFLGDSNLSNYRRCRGGGYGEGKRFGSCETYVSVFVVVDVDFYGPG